MYIQCRPLLLLKCNCSIRALMTSATLCLSSQTGGRPEKHSEGMAIDNDIKDNRSTSTALTSSSLMPGSLACTALASPTRPIRYSFSIAFALAE